MYLVPQKETLSVPWKGQFTRSQKPVEYLSVLQTQPKQRAVVRVSRSSIILILLGCAAASFEAGRFLQHSLLSSSYARQLGFHYPPLEEREDSVGEGGIPSRNYASAHFDATHVVRSYSLWHENTDGEQCAAEFGNITTCSTPSVFVEQHPQNTDSTEDEDEDEEEGPNGLHLLVDIEHVDSEFLNSEEHLARAMVELIEQTEDVTILSYHCHGLAPTGVSCVGMLNPGTAVTFHTWPIEGVITMDIYVTRDTLPTLESVRSLFGVPSKKDSEQAAEPRMVWAKKHRGFVTTKGGMERDVDLPWKLGPMDDRFEHVAAVETTFQSIVVADLKETRFGGESASREQKDRVVYLDGVMQSRRFGEAAYHETLVHPALFTHGHPRRVVIVGGGEGATLREVLKHESVEEVIMVEIDELMVTTSRQYLPEWSDCSDLEGSADSCFDDPRARVYFEDAIQWFIDRFGGGKPIAKEDQFDVIIMDALDPSTVVEFSDFLYKNNALVNSFSNALGESGILVAQVGAIEVFNAAFPFIDGLDAAGFQSVVGFEEAHGRFEDAWGFILAMKDWDTRANWFRNSAEWNSIISPRLLRTKNGELPLRWFDGATMMNYLSPSRDVEDTWCRQYPKYCAGGHGFNPELLNFPASSFEVKPSAIAKGGRGIFAKEFIPQGTLIGLEECVAGMHAHSTTFDVLEQAKNHFGGLSEFWSVVWDGYMDGYGWTSREYGLLDSGVDPGILTYINHGCDGKYNIGKRFNETEATIEEGEGPENFYGERKVVAFNPFDDRHFPLWQCTDSFAQRDIQAGEELFDNYMHFGGDQPEAWEANLAELKAMCSEGVGRVFQYEEAHQFAY